MRLPAGLLNAVTSRLSTSPVAFANQMDRRAGDGLRFSTRAVIRPAETEALL